MSSPRFVHRYDMTHAWERSCFWGLMRAELGDDKGPNYRPLSLADEIQDPQTDDLIG